MEPKIIHENNSFIICEKPPKYPVQSDKTGDYDLLNYLSDYMKNKGFEDPYIRLIHRLDRPVGGIIVFSKNEKSTADLAKQLQNRTFQKKYLAVVSGHVINDKTLIDYLKKKSDTNISRIVTKDAKNAKEAILKYKVLERISDKALGDLSLLEIELKTGRHHQIRVQLANDGFPIWGDTKYNNEFINKRGWFQIALWAYSLSFISPKNKKLVSYKSTPIEMEIFNKFKNQLL